MHQFRQIYPNIGKYIQAESNISGVGVVLSREDTLNIWSWGAEVFEKVSPLLSGVICDAPDEEGCC